MGWIALFFVVPLLIVLKISFAESIFAAPPYTQLLQWVGDAAVTIHLNLHNYALLIQDNLYIFAYFNSLGTATVATFLCLFLGYPMAYGIARAPGKWQILLLLLVILPFWTSFLIRVYAWIGLLSPLGVFNNFLIAVGFIQDPLPLLNNYFSVCIGMVYSYIPFMILPLYASLEKMNLQLLEAASDLGCRPFWAFLRITLPLSLKGIVAGTMLVFIPAVGEFVIPELLGGPENLMIGRLLWMEFFNNQDWPVASAITIALLGLLVVPLVALQRLQMKVH
ncbi:MAG: ABC transporter permease subunit [Pseudomonadota bacterium]